MGKKIIDDPPLRSVETKKIGEKMIEKGSQSFREAVEILGETKFNKKAGESSIMTCALSVIPGKVFKKGVYETEGVKADCYGPVQFRRTLADGNTNWNCPGLPLIVGDICKEENGRIFLAIVSSRVYLEQDFDKIKFGVSAIEGKDNFVQDIVYSGKAGDKMKFIYREFSDSAVKPDYFQEFEFDSADTLIKFKNVELEISEATHELITYKVIRSF